MTFAHHPPPWTEDARDSPLIARNVAQLDAEFAARRGHREPFGLAIPATWHVQIHNGCQHIPVADYVGNFRGARRMHIDRYEVRFDRLQGVLAPQVADALAVFERNVQATLRRFDQDIASPDAATSARLNLLLEDVAVLYAEWIRIHPFADGNGRTARLLANWLTTRYWQPLVFPGRPPVDKDKLIAATAPAVDPGTQDHRPLVRLLRRRLADARLASSGPR